MFEKILNLFHGCLEWLFRKRERRVDTLQNVETRIKVLQTAYLDMKCEIRRLREMVAHAQKTQTKEDIFEPRSLRDQHKIVIEESKDEDFMVL